MYKKTDYIIPALILCFSLVLLAFPLISLSNGCDEDTTTTTKSSPTTTKSSSGSSEILDYRCHTCNSSGKCTENVYSKPCSDDCSGCKTYTCKICSGTSCISKTFDSPCSNNCTTDYGCGAGSTQGTMSCKVCSGGQCVSKMFEGDCTDECTGAENCVSGATTTTKKPKDKWCCNNSTGMVL